MRDLDRRIRQWAEIVKPGKADAPRTPEQIVRLLETGKRAEKRGLLFPGRRNALLKAFAALSACVLLTLAVFRSGNAGKHRFLSLQKSELTEISRVCSELERLFPEGMQWGRIANGRIEMQAGDPRRITPASDPGKVLLSFDMVSKRNGKVVSQKRNAFVIWGEEPVEIKEEGANTLWIQKIGENKLYISLNLTMANDPCQVHLQDDYLQTIGSSQMIASKISGEEVCEFYQTAYLL
jgi:hypothetical protein